MIKKSVVIKFGFKTKKLASDTYKLYLFAPSGVHENGLNGKPVRDRYAQIRRCPRNGRQVKIQQ